MFFELSFWGVCLRGLGFFFFVCLLSCFMGFFLFQFVSKLTALLPAVGPHLGFLPFCRNFHAHKSLVKLCWKKGIFSRRPALGSS